MKNSTFHPPQGPCFADLSGKVALVTGGGSGIGRGTCLRLAAEGMRVVLCGRTESTLRETVQLVEARDGKAEFIVADTGIEGDIEKLAAHLKEKYGQLDALIHNAALMAGRHNLDDNDSAFWRQMFATNADGAFYLVKQCLPLMGEGGSIIFISTIGAQRAHRGLLAYDASKGAIDAFSRALALELAPRIRVNSIAPGPIAGIGAKGGKPPSHRNVIAFHDEINLEEFHNPNIPMQRHGTPAEIAAAVAFLSSTQSSFITGQILNVDGGATTQLAPPGMWI
jgi:NAD(P)-dependent dehydrogenase (short-subunit alcohol dehydrogenase family)